METPSTGGPTILRVQAPSGVPAESGIASAVAPAATETVRAVAAT